MIYPLNSVPPKNFGGGGTQLRGYSITGVRNYGGTVLRGYAIMGVRNYKIPRSADGGFVPFCFVVSFF